MKSRTKLALGLSAIALAAMLTVVAITSPDRPSGPVVSTYAGDGKRRIGADGADRRSTSIESPTGMAWDSDGNLLYLERGRETGALIRRIQKETGVVQTIAGGGELEPVNVPALEARLPPLAWGLAVDADGNVYICADTAGVVLRIDAYSSLVSPLIGKGMPELDPDAAEAPQTISPEAIHIGSNNDVYLTDIELHIVRALDAETGMLRLVAGVPGEAGHSGDGGPASDARLNTPSDVTVARDGDLYVADTYNHVIRHVEADTGVISTFAGLPGRPGFAGDGMDRSRAQFSYPSGLLLQADVLLVADRMNHRVRSINLISGLVETVAGSGETFYSGENIDARSASIYEPVMMVTHPDGGFLVAGERARRIFAVGDPVAVPVPLWRSSWAIASYVAVVLLAAMLIERRQTRVLRARTAELQANVAARRQELKDRKALIEQQAQALRSLIDEKDQLIARVSHEFRTPLSVILGPIERLSRHTTDAPLKHYLTVTKRNSERLLRLVDDLLELGRLRSGMAVDTVPVSVTPLIRQVVAAVDSYARQRGVQVGQQLIEDCAVQTTTAAFETITLKMLCIAIEISPCGAIIRITQEIDGDNGRLVVGVSGVGKTSSGRSETPPEDNVPESDIGWLLVQQLAAAHGGAADRSVGPHSMVEFRVSLPVAKGPVGKAEDMISIPEVNVLPEPEAGPLEPIAAEARATTILIIEDNPDMRHYLQALLERHYICLLAEGGHRGLALAEEAVPDLVLCDVLLPGLHGYSVCRALKQNEVTCHIPIILLTALQDSETRRRSLGERPDDFITKPFREAELLGRVANLLEIRSMLRRRYSRELRIDAPLPDDMAQADKMFLARLERVCEEHHSSPTLDISEMAKRVGLSKRQLQRKARALLNLTPAEYLRNFRLQSAHKRLVAGQRPSDVAMAVGFSSHSYFSSSFKTKYGYAPGEARRGAKAEFEA